MDSLYRVWVLSRKALGRGSSLQGLGSGVRAAFGLGAQAPVRSGSPGVGVLGDVEGPVVPVGLQAPEVLVAPEVLQTPEVLMAP